MNLLVDAGNTKTKSAAFSKKSGFNEVIELECLKESELGKLSFDNLVISKVSGQSLNELVKDLRFNKLIEVKVDQRAFGIECGYEEIRNLGVDRWVGVLGAELLYPNQNIIVVDAGTATTIDFLTSDKHHVGGWVIPGFDLMKQSIVNKAPNVFSADLTKQEVIGTNTPSALHNGCLAAQQGSVYKALQHCKDIFDESETKVILTGGASPLISESLDFDYTIEPNLLFHGLSRFC